MAGRVETCIVREIINQDVKTYFIDNHYYFNRKGFYCHFDDGERFAFFCNAILEMLPRIDFIPDIIHCNDWHTGPICMLLKEKYKNNPIYNKITTVMTIHNLEYQGLYPKDLIYHFGVSERVFTSDKVEFYGSFNYMKAGLSYADKINAVSVKYSEEIKTSEHGENLEGLTQYRKEDIRGIVNGIDYNDFNPDLDKNIYVNFDNSNLSLKYENKRLLKQEMGLDQIDVPLIGVVHRLTAQKGLNLVLDTFESLIKKYNCQFVLLGQGDPYFENKFNELMKSYPGMVSVKIEFNEKLARRIYAGSDLFLMPSVFEPCGLGQLISLRYGTIPVVRVTGGLAETVLDIEKDTEKGNGFTFTQFSAEEFEKTMDRALKLYIKDPSKWTKMVNNAMDTDNSWNNPAKKYVEMYFDALNKGNR